MRSFFIYLLGICTSLLIAQQQVPVKPRILVSTDIGGTDPDDNQSMTHLLMYSDKFDIEGLISSPSYGNGNKREILRMINLYSKDLTKLKKHQKNFPSPQHLRRISKQGVHGGAPYVGYSTPTQGSKWMIKCAKKRTDKPLWILVWGGLEDLAQALHDAPEIQDKIRVYWIGGPNKKWSLNSYAYIVENFPKLWFIEVNSSYYGFFSNNQSIDSISVSDYYNRYIKAAGYLGKDFKKYYGGEIKMGDTPSLLYMMDGDPNNPMRESWGGSFDKLNHSPRIVYNRPTSIFDSVAFCSIIEFHFKGPAINIPKDSACFWMETPFKNTTQKWPGYYLGNGDFAIRFAPKQAGVLEYSFTTNVQNLSLKKGEIVVENQWPGKNHATDYKLEGNWYTDKRDTTLFEGKIQGGKTVSRWRTEALLDWAERWNWLQ